MKIVKYSPSRGSSVWIERGRERERETRGKRKKKNIG
jgi:hypothetical protein